VPIVTGTDDCAGAAEFVPGPDAALQELAAAVQRCRGCDLYQRATQAVFGRGSPSAAVLLVGEQPGDAEDRAGEPFVGPAGRLLDRALAEAGIPPESTYATNAVKHFRWRTATERGKRRIHQRPEAWQVRACWPWLEAELARLDPDVVVALGATAGQALFGSGFRVTAQRGVQLTWTAADGAESLARELTVVPTIHPSAVLRADDRDAAYAAFAGLVADLRVAASVAVR
jgi:uracil-DNA glycosylase